MTHHVDCASSLPPTRACVCGADDDIDVRGGLLPSVEALPFTSTDDFPFSADDDDDDAKEDMEERMERHSLGFPRAKAKCARVS